MKKKKKKYGSSVYQLTLILAITTAVEDNFDYFFFYLPEKTSSDIEMSGLVFSENRKKNTCELRLSSITNFSWHNMG